MHTADNDPNQEYYNYPDTENVTRFNATAIYTERREFASPTFETFLFLKFICGFIGNDGLLENCGF
jgi:hypothetical protein